MSEQLEQRLRQLEATLLINPRDPWTHSRRGHVLLQLGRLDEALAAFTKVSALDPKLPEGPQGVGEVEYAQGKTAAAHESFKKALALNALHVPTLASLIRFHEARSEYQQAEPYFKRILESPKADDPEWIRRAAFNLYRQKKFTQALPVLVQAREKLPKDDEVTIALGVSFANSGKLIEARGLLEPFSERSALSPADDAVLADVLLALEDWPRAARVWLPLKSDRDLAQRARLGLGRCHEEMSLHRDAIEELTSIADSALSADITWLLARAFLGIDDASQALRYAELGLSRFTTDARLHYFAGKALMQLGRVQDAVASLERAVRYAPSAIEPLELLAEGHIRLERYDAASHDFARLVEIAPQDPRLQLARAQFERAHGTLQRAEQCFARAFEVDPGSSLAALGAAQCANDLSNPAAARHWVDRALELEPTLVSALQLSGMLHLQAGNPRDALAHLIQASTLSPSDAGILRMMAACYRSLEEPEHEAELLERSLQIAFEDAAAKRLGRVSLGLKRYERAVELLARVVEHSPRDAEAQSDLGLAHEYLRDLPKARAAFAAACDIDRSHAGNHFALGRVCLVLNDPAAAVTALEHAMRLGDHRAEVTMRLGEAYQRLGLLREASQEYRKITTLTPSDVPASFALGSVLAELGEHAEAAHHLERVVEYEPNHGAGWLRLGIERLATDQPQQAAECFRKATSLLPDSPEAFRGLAQAAARIQQHDEAARATRQWLRLEPDNLDALALLAESLESLTRYEEARETWLQRLKLEPDASDAEVRLGIVLMKLLRFDAAAETMARALERSHSRNVEHWELLADCYERLGDKEGLLSALATVCEIDPSSGARWRRLGLAEYAVGHEPKAILALENAWKVGATDREIQDLLTKLFRARAERELLAEQLDAALGSYRKAVEYEPNQAALFIALGRLLVRLAQHEQALPVFERASTLDGKNAGTQLELARLLRHLGNTDHALLTYSKALKLQPENREALAGFAELQRSLGDPAQALAALQQLVKLEPNQPEYRLELGALLLDEKRPSDAAEHLALAADALPLDPRAQYLLGHCHAELGQDAQAVPAFERALTQVRQLDWCRELVSSLQRLGKIPDVVDALSPFRGTPGWTSLDAAELGFALAKVGRDRDAIELLREAIVENPTDDLHDVLLAALWRTNAHGEVVQCAEAILSANPTHRKALEYGAKALLELGTDDARATSLLERLLALDPSNTDAKQQVVRLRSKRAVAALDQSSDEAIRELQRALELSPSDPRILFQLASCYARAGRAQQALDHAIRCLGFDDTHQPAWVLRGELEGAAGRQVAARTSFERAVSLEPSDPAAHVGLAQVLEALSEHALASEQYRALCELQPSVVAWRERLVALASRPGEEQAAIEHLTALSALRSLSLEERRCLAFLEAKHGSHEHAIAHLSQVLESIPSDKGCMAQLAASLAAVGREADGIPWLERLVRLEATYPQAQARLGISLSNADRHDAAIGYLEWALTHDAEDLEVKKALVRTYAALEKPQKQLDVLLTVASVEPNVAQHLEMIGQLYLDLGRESEAIEPWTKAVALADNPKLRERLYELLMEHADQALADGQRQAAQELLIRAKDQAQTSAPRLLACARRLRDAGDREHATEVALQSRALSDGPPINLLLGELWIERERPLEAIQCFEHALQFRVDSVDALTGLGRAQIAAAAYADAETTLQQAAHLAPDDARPVELLVDLYVRTSRLDRAVTAQNTAVALRKHSVDALARLGDLEMLAGNPRRAVEPFESAYRQAPANERVRAALAQCYWMLERWPDLLTLAEASLAQNPALPDWHEWRGKALGRLDRLSDAITELEQVRLVRANDMQLEQLLAELYARSGQSAVADPRQAAAALQQAMTHGDNRVVTRRELARALRAIGELHDAVRWAESCVRDEPTPEHWILLGELDAMLGRYERAVQAFESAVSADARNISGWQGLGLAYEQLGRFDVAINALNSAIEIVPTIAALEALARIQARQRHWQPALDAVTQLHRLRAPLASELRQIATLLRHLDRPRDALASYQRAIELDPNDVESLFALGTLRLELGDSESALEALEAAQRLNPQYPGIDEQLAIAYGATGRHEQALACARRQLSREKTETLLRVVAQAEEALGRHQEAAAALAEIASMGGDSAHALLELGIAQAKAGSTERAIQALSRARELSGGTLGTSELSDLLLSAISQQMSQGNRERALGLIEQALRVATEAPAVQFELAKLLVALEFSERAYEVLKSAAPYLKQSVEPSNLAAEICAKNQRWQEAYGWYERANAIQIDDETSLIGLGRSLTKLGRYGEARVPLMNALKQRPHDEELAQLLLESLQADTSVDHRRQILEALLRARPADWRVKAQLAALEAASQNHLRVIEILAELELATPSDPEHLMLLAQSYHAQARTGDCQRVCQLVLRQHPNHQRAMRLLGLSQAQQGDHRGAITALESAVAAAATPELVRQLYDLYCVEAHRNENLGNSHAAAQCYARAVELDPADVATRITLARLQISLGDRNQAIQTLRQGLEHSVEHLERFVMLGQLYLEAGRSDLGVEAFRTARQLSPASRAIAAQLGIALARQGLDAEALDLLPPFANDPEFGARVSEELANLQRRRGDLGAAAEHLEKLRKSQALTRAQQRDLALVWANSERYAEAREMLSELFRSDPSDFDVSFAYGAVAKRVGALNESAAALKSALRLKPERGEISYQLAEVLLAQGESAEALAAFERALSLGCNTAELHELVAACALRMGNRTRWIQALRARAALLPRVAAVHADLADALVQTESYGEARTAYEKAVALEQNPRWLRALADCCSALSDPIGQLQALSSLCELQPNHASVHAQCGLARFALGHLHAAVEEFRQALTLDPSIEEIKHPFTMAARQVADEYVRNQDDRAALPLYEQILAIRPHTPDLLLQAASCYGRLRQFEPATRLLREALSLAPGDEALSLLLGSVLVQSGKKTDAAAIYEAALQRNPSSTLIARRLALQYDEQGRFVDAAQVLGRAYDLPKIDVDYLLAYMSALTASGRPADAIQVGYAGLERFLGSAELLQRLGALYAGQGWHEQSIDLLLRAVAIEPPEASRYYLLVRELLEIGRDAEAAQWLDVALSKFPREASLASHLLALAARTDAAKDYRRSLQLYQRAVDADPNNIRGYQGLSNALVVLNQTDRALEVLEQAVRLTPNDDQLRYYIGSLYAAQRRLADATRHWDVLRKLNPQLAIQLAQYLGV